MNIKGSITLSRVNCSHSDDYISIRLEDEAARITFAEVKLGLTGFAHMLTGLSGVECDIEVSGLENVGKIKERKQASFELPEGTKFTEERTAALAVLAEINDGWTYSTYLGSQNTFYSDGDKCFFRTWAARWIDKDEAE